MICDGAIENYIFFLFVASIWDNLFFSFQLSNIWQKINKPFLSGNSWKKESLVCWTRLGFFLCEYSLTYFGKQLLPLFVTTIKTNESHQHPSSFFLSSSLKLLFCKVQLLNYKISLAMYWISFELQNRNICEYTNWPWLGGSVGWIITQYTKMLCVCSPFGVCTGGNQLMFLSFSVSKKNIPIVSFKVQWHKDILLH